MKKETFKYLYSFKYNNKDYIYLISKNYPFYFLEYDASQNIFDYPDIDTFKDLYNKFYSNSNILCLNIVDELKHIKAKLLNINVDIEPVIRTTSGFLSLALILGLCGCAQTDKFYSSSDNENVEASLTKDKNQQIYNYFKNYDIEVINKEYNGADYIFVRDYINDNNKHQITLQSFEEFRKLKNIDFVPTWEDVIKVFQDNENIDNEKEKIILDGLNNMKNCEELKGIDLSVLYENAKRMDFKYLTTSEMVNSTGRETAYAYFDTVTGTVYLPSDKPLKKFEFIHEVLGHGALAYREETEDSLIVFDCTNHLMLSTDDKFTGHQVGIMVSEGGANMIAHLATNDYSVSTFYELYEEQLRVISELCNVSIGELFNHKGISLYDLMYKNGISTPVEYIFKMDGVFKGKLYCEFSYLMERLFVDATEEKFINSSSAKQEQIIEATVKIIEDSYFKDREELTFSYPGGAIKYNFEKSADRYQENMNEIRAKSK